MHGNLKCMKLHHLILINNHHSKYAGQNPNQLMNASQVLFGKLMYTKKLGTMVHLQMKNYFLGTVILVLSQANFF